MRRDAAQYGLSMTVRMALTCARRQLLEDKEVHFAGYRVPHPLEPAIQVKVQTRTDNPGPVDAVHNALNKLTNELSTFSKKFEESLQKYDRTGGVAKHDPLNDQMHIG